MTIKVGLLNVIYIFLFFVSKQWDKKVHMLENNAFFFGKQCFFKAMF